VESLFSTEYSMTLQTVTLALNDTPYVQRHEKPFTNISLLQNKPNPFDESTLITVLSGTDLFYDRAWISIADLSGRIIKRLKIPLKKGVNEISFNHGYGTMNGVYVYTLFVDGLPVQSRKMLLGKQ
jgi:hypothetical protein